MRVDLGTLPQWFAAPAVLLAVVGLWLEQRKSRRERREKHAVNVSAWVDREGTATAEDLRRFENERPPCDLDGIGWVVVVRLRNGNPVPVYHVQYSVSAGVKGTAVRGIHVVPPECTLEFLVPFPSPPRSNMLSPQIVFVDAAGIKWVRRTDGMLKEVGKRSHYLEPHPGSFQSFEQHPTLSMPHPYRVVPADELPAAGRVHIDFSHYG